MSAACGLDQAGLEEFSPAGGAGDASTGTPRLPDASPNHDPGMDRMAPAPSDATGRSDAPDFSEPSDATRDPEQPADGSASSETASPPDSALVPDVSANDAPEDDATSPAADAAPTPCHPTSPFGTPVLVEGIESDATEGGLRMTPDELTGFFWSTRPGGPGTVNLYVATRPGPTAAFGMVSLLSGIDMAGSQYDPSVTADGLTLAFGSDRASSDGTYDLFLATRATTGDDFSDAAPISDLNTSADDQQPYLLPDGSEMYFSSNTSGDSDIYRARRKTGGGFAAPSAVTELNTAGVADEHPAVSADGLTIFFSSTRPGGVGNIDVWTATRSSSRASFGTITNVGSVNSTSKDIPDWISPDGCRLYLHSDRDGGSPHEYVATRSP
jgi:Tol biopolymer transport system component